MLYGSSSHSPDVALLALVLTTMPSTNSLWPEVSTWPPLPPSMPPFAKMLPCISVVEPEFETSLQSTSLPPPPFLVALASITAPWYILIVVAWRSEPEPCQSPPIKITPPPVAPVAWRFACAPKRIFLASRVIWPADESWELTLSWPLMLIRFAASKLMVPPSPELPLVCTIALVKLISPL